jgi:hypothetical protein
MEHYFFLSDLEGDELSQFFNDVLDPVIAPWVEIMDENEEDNYKHQLLYFTWLIYTGKVFPDLQARQYPVPLVYGKNIQPVNQAVLLALNPFPDLYSLAKDMRLSWHCYNLFDHTGMMNIHEAWESELPFLGDEQTDEDHCFTLQDTEDCEPFTILRMHNRGSWTGMASVITQNGIQYLPLEDDMVQYFLNHPSLETHEPGINPFTYTMNELFIKFTELLNPN